MTNHPCPQKSFQKLSELVKNVVPYYQFANPKEKEQITRVIFSELYVSENTLKYKVKDGFECFENRFDAIGEPKVWLSELFEYEENIKDSVKELKLVII